MKIKTIIFGVIIYCLFSISSIFMKLASMQNIFVYKSLLFGVSLFLLGIFSILWQKLLSTVNLNKAYYFKGTTILWGLIFGILVFNEKISINMIVGSVICLFGVVVILGDKNYE